MRHARRQGLDRQVAAGRNRAHRHHRRSKCGSIPSSATTSRSPSPTWTRCRRITSASRPSPTANGSSRPELKEMEGKILGAEERSVKLEYELFQRVREEVLGAAGRNPADRRGPGATRRAGRLRRTARLYNYCRPEMGDDGMRCNPRRPPSGAGTER